MSPVTKSPYLWCLGHVFVLEQIMNLGWMPAGSSCRWTWTNQKHVALQNISVEFHSSVDPFRAVPATKSKTPGTGMQSMIAGWWPSTWHRTCTSKQGKDMLSLPVFDCMHAGHMHNHSICCLLFTPCADTSFAEHLLSTLGRGVPCWTILGGCTMRFTINNSWDHAISINIKTPTWKKLTRPTLLRSPGSIGVGSAESRGSLCASVLAPNWYKLPALAHDI
jgi:hypothetical protein